MGRGAPEEEQATLDTRAWPRRALNQSRVAEFVQLYQDGGPDALPRVEVVPLGNGEFVVADGFHRAEALEQLGVSDIPTVTLDPPPGQDPLLFAYLRALETSARNAKPLTLAEKRAAADRLIRDMPEASNHEIGRLTGLSHQTVGRIRERSNGPADAPAAEPADQYPPIASAKEIAAKMARSVDRLWEARGLTDVVMGERRMGKHLAAAFLDYFGEDAARWAERFAGWATVAAEEISSRS
jgi:hypothetical protein